MDIQATTLVACPKLARPQLEELRFDGSKLTYKLLDGRTKAMAAAEDTEVSMYLIGVKSDRLEPVPAPIYPSGKVKTPQDRAAAAIEALMAVKARKEAKYSSLWNKVCRLGTGVRSVEALSSEPVVVVTLTGRGGALCDMTQEGYDLRSQQLAWTVVKNLEVDESTPVRILVPDGKALLADIVPDRSFLAIKAN